MEKIKDKVDIDKLLLTLRAIPSDFGVYPQAVKGLSEEKDYEQRDGFKNGWNACVFEYLSEVGEAVRDAYRPWSEAERLFAATEEDYTFLYSSDTKEWGVFLNDTWYYASGDLEEIPTEKMDEVASWYRDYGDAGVMYWVYLQRGHLPEIPRTRIKVKAIEKLLADLREEKQQVEVWRSAYYKGKKIRSFFSGLLRGLKK